MNALNYSVVTAGVNCILDIDSIKLSIASDFESSSESSYWKRRSAENYKKVESYRSFTSSNNRKAKKRLCENRREFKKSKRWYGYEEKYWDYEAYSYEILDSRKQLPYRNKVYCACCGKNKILFEEKSKADNFIKFNREIILAENGYAPIRSYYCSLCGGWHVTSLLEDPERNDNNGLCLAERVVISIIDSKSSGKENTSIEPCQEALNTEENINDLLKEIKNSFNNEMDRFFVAYRNKELAICKEIHYRIRTMFLECELPYKEIDKIKKRILDAQINIDKLTEVLKKEEEEKKMLIWGIQKVFREEFDKFKHAYALRKINDCYSIYMRMSTAINESRIQLPFIKAIKMKLNYMLQCLENLIDSRVDLSSTSSTVNLSVTQYLEAVWK